MNFEKYNSEKILMTSNPGDIFTQEGLKQEYRDLVKFWHPDVNEDPKAGEVIKKINELYNLAKEQIVSGTWVSTGRIKIPGKKSVYINYLFTYDFPFGKAYICKNSLIYHFKKDYIKFADNYMNRVSGLKYADSNMRDRMRYFIPSMYDTIDVDDGKLILLDKNPRLIRLRDMLDYFGGKLDNKHVAWIISSLLNILCFIQYNNLSNNGIDLDSYYIDPTDHNGTLYGGWWFSVNLSDSLIGASREVFDVSPKRVKDAKIGSIETDIESVKLVGRCLLGDRYLMDRNIVSETPSLLVEYLREPALKTAYAEYERWENIKSKAYKREFVKMNIDSKEVYKF